jgi:hypothetical protein
MRRLPLWTALLPLVIGIAVYWWYWDQQRAAFRTLLEAAFGEDQPFRVTGFPYRLEATFDRVMLRRQGFEWLAQLSAEGAIVNRQPWRPDLTILRLESPRALAGVPPLSSARLDLEGIESQTSLRWTDGRIARLSTEIGGARIALALLPETAIARRFELHFRETPTTLDPASRAPTFPRQAQLVLAGEALRFGGGDPLTFAAEAALTAPKSVRSFAAWRQGGTVELKRLTLADETGEVLAMSATLTPDEDGALRVAGAIDTVCPVSVEAAFAGRPAPAEERRARRPVRLAFQGTPGDYRLALPAAGLPRVPVRGQEPPCPVIRR